MVDWYWSRNPGTLIYEFPAVSKSKTNERRRIDGVIIRGGEHRVALASEKLSLVGQDVIVLQAKTKRLGMHLMGQVVFSAKLIEERFQPRSVLSVALVKFDDSVMRKLLEAIPGMKVEVCPEEIFTKR